MGKGRLQKDGAGCSQDGAETEAIPGSDLTVFAKCVPPSRRQSYPQEEEFQEKEGGVAKQEVGGWSSDSESGSAVSLERNLLEEHLYCIRWELRMFDKQIFSFERMSANALKAESAVFSDSLTVQEYLQNGESLLDPPEAECWLRLLRDHDPLEKYLQVLFDSASQLYCDELLLAAYRTAAEYWRFKHLDLDLRELSQLAADPLFLRTVYFHPRLPLIGSHLPNPPSFTAALARFQQAFSLTLLLVLENYFHNPGYVAAREEQGRVRKERQGRRKWEKRVGEKRISKARLQAA